MTSLTTPAVAAQIMSGPVYRSSITRISGVGMIVIVGLVVLLVAVIVGFTGVLTIAGPDQLLTENFSL